MRGQCISMSDHKAQETGALADRWRTNTHVPVMPAEVLELLGIRPGGTYVDATLGAGGHASLICAAVGAEGRVVGIDWDPDALRVAHGRLAEWGDRVVLRRGNFRDMGVILRGLGIRGVDGVLMDLGVSSLQLADTRRGFSFRGEGDLDMRMDPSLSLTAAQILNSAEMDELTSIFGQLGEIRRARALARAVIKRRQIAPLRTVADLAEVANEVLGGAGARRLHAATNVFRALRMTVNAELENLCAGLEEALRVLWPEGRLVVISFHSLEDRLVKDCFRRHEGRRMSLPEGGQRVVFDPPRVRILTRKPLIPRADELRMNPRARSAKLRAAERVENGA